MYYIIYVYVYVLYIHASREARSRLCDILKHLRLDWNPSHGFPPSRVSSNFCVASTGPGTKS